MSQESETGRVPVRQSALNKITWTLTKTFNLQENRRKTSPYPNATNIKARASPQDILVGKEVCVCMLCINRTKKEA